MKFSKNLFTLLALCCLTASVNAQTLPEQWTQTFKGQGKNADRIAKIKTLGNGDVVVAGYSGGPAGWPDAFALKYNAQGDTLWEYRYDGPINDEDYVLAMAVDANDNVYLTGKSAGNGYLDQCITIKLDANGNEQWVNRYTNAVSGESQGNAIAVDNVGNVYVAGWFDGLSGGQEWLVIKYNSIGQTQWVDFMDSPANVTDLATDIVIDANQQATVCGMVYENVAGGGENILVKQYTTSGNTAWTNTYTNPTATGPDRAVAIRLAANGNFLVGGTTYTSSSYTDILAISYSPVGFQNWAAVYSDSTTSIDEQLYAMEIDNAGNIYLAGTDYASHMIYRINANGSQAWKKLWQGTLPFTNELPFDITTDGNGGIYTVGKGIYPGPDYFGNGGLDNFIVVKYNDNGDSLWTYRVASNTDLSIGFAITYKDGKIYAGGFKSDTAYVDEDFFTLILDTAGALQDQWKYNGTGNSITRGQVVRTDAQDNIYCAATIDRLYYNGLDVAVVKYDPAGNLLWERYYTTPSWRNDTLNGMEIDPSGNLILNISSDSSGSGSGFRPTLVKLSPAGVFLDTAWYPSYLPGISYADKMLVRNDGSVAICGTASIIGGYIAFFDNQLNYQWTAMVDSTQFALTRANSIAAFQNNDIALTGYVQTGAGGTGKLIVQRYDALGNRIWSTEIDSAGTNDEGKDLIVNAADEIAVAGSSGAAALLAKLNGTGQLLWRSIFNPTTSTSEYGVKVRFAPSGSVVIISRGWTGFVARYYTAQFNGSTGNAEWSQTYSQQASDREPVELLVESTGRVVTAGWRIQTGSTNYDYVLVGYNSAGVLAFENTFTSPNLEPDQLRSMTIDTQGDIIVTGESATDFLNNYLFRIVTIKYGGSPVSISESVKRSTLSVFPNPSSSGKFYLLDESGGAAISRVRIFSADGKMISVRNDLSVLNEIDLSANAVGLYLIQIERKDNTFEIVRVMRN